ncbi:hypothetical protein PCANC_00107 [Puccinia coronata f. sp. avenae]|uniref:Smr domain-containing protein n=1 Tax=Puccinia coronata f. sp. avenae TaxID=200324 RepID=A0A2N5W8X7_9BASI|nr:hypothetical protein PCASD_21111 [Puccinia coronata f. sp. avenae]PLW46403.1 hypothetical protein PCASD_05471 [Puccinia coronata f. sp. avenae]PLW58668.1 hypothetical protein PCANC_00107 [Puccinia coronata f. sp. avenae]
MCSSTPNQNAILERLLKKFSPPIEPSVVFAISSDYNLNHPSQEAELDRILSELITPESREQQWIQHIQSISPQTSEHFIQQVIDNAPEPKTLPHIIDVLFPQTPTPPTPPPPPPPPLPPPNQHQKRKKPPKNETTFLLTDLLQRGNRQQSSEQVQHHKERNSINNDWIFTESQIAYVATLLDIEASKIRSICHRKNGNLVLALEELLSVTEYEKSKEIPQRQDQFDLQLDFLRNALSTVSDEVLTRLLVVTDMDPGNALDLWIFLDELHARAGSVAVNQFRHAHQGSSSSVSLPATPTSNATKPTRASLQTLSPAATTHEGSTTTPTLAHQARDIEHTLQVLRSRREHLRQKASSSRQQLLASSSGGGTGTPSRQALQHTISAMYAADAHRLGGQIQEWERHLASQTVARRQRLANDPFSIDLHGLTRHQALPVTRHYLQEWWAAQSHSANTFNTSFVHPFRIITGAGTHSAHSRPALLPAITALLQQERWKWRPEDHRADRPIGALLVVGKLRS